jgi:hypothetical protein
MGRAAGRCHGPIPAIADRQGPRFVPAGIGTLSHHVEGDGPSEPSETGHFAPLGPSEPRKGPKRQRTDEERLGLGGVTPKHRCLVAPR